MVTAAPACWALNSHKRRARVYSHGQRRRGAENTMGSASSYENYQFLKDRCREEKKLNEESTTLIKYLVLTNQAVLVIFSVVMGTI
jgi:hypothetical protein